jgi:molybdenum cofactor cytidylyltransferase
VRVHIVVLAAGTSSRFGSNKLLHHIDSHETLFDRAIAACGSYPTLVVASSNVASIAESRGLSYIINEEPDRGMSYSLRLANAEIPPDRAIAILPADLLEATAARVASVIDRAGQADVTFPARTDGTPGHPVIFSPRARTSIGELPDGDTIRLLRDRAGLTRATIPIEEPWPYRDVDVAADLPASSRLQSNT